MSRPLHLERRGAVYYVRLRIPIRLTETLGKTDFRRSLGTKEYAAACRRCNAVAAWFDRTMERMEKMGSLDRGALEEAANSYFAELLREIDQPRDLPADNFDAALAFQIEASKEEMQRQHGRLIAHEYSDGDRNEARAMLESIGVNFDLLAVGDQTAALAHVVRAQRQQMRYLLHSLQTPASRYVPDDEIFAIRQIVTEDREKVLRPASAASPKFFRPDLTLGDTTSAYYTYLVQTERQGSTRDETARVLRWLQEEIDPSTPVSVISHDQMRDFRDCLLALRTGGQGKRLPFRHRLAAPGQENLKFVTRQRYWRFTTKFFGWLLAEYRIPDPTQGLLFEGGRNELRQSPAPFTTEELQLFLRTPLFTGYLSPHRLMVPGKYIVRNGYWWSAMVMMFSGARAGDVAQLLTTDFRFEDDVPHFIIQPGKLPEGQAKRSKFGPRTHKVPLHPALLELGIRAFVEGRAKHKQSRRVFNDIGLGENRMSTGLTKFWGRYLRAFELFLPQRATHVHRHTLAARLRAAHVSNEDIGAVLGHSNTSTTAMYGGDQDLKRKLVTLQKLDFGFDVVSSAGGPYDPKVHR